MRSRSIVPAAWCLVSVLATPTFLTEASAATDPVTACEATKVAATGKHAAAMLSCFSKAARDGSPPDGACTGKSLTKMTDGFVGAESKFGVECGGVFTPTANGISELTVSVSDVIEVPTGGGLCASLATKFAGKFAGALFKAYSSDHKSPDPVRLADSIDKARASLLKGITGAEGKDGCTATGQYEDVRVLIEGAVYERVACIVGLEACEEVADDVEGGETITTDPDGSGPTDSEPVTSSVETPNAGTIIIEISDPVGAPPTGYEVLGQQVEITAPDATATSPLVLTFTIDASLVPGDPSAVTVTRDGVLVGNCTGAAGVADPDPCVEERNVLPSGDLEIVVLSSHASVWVPVYDLPSTGCPTSMLMDMLADNGVTDYATELDIGWKGFLHGIDRAGGTSFAMTLDCGASPFPACETCTITGFDPSYNNCRCANNTRVTCDEPFAADADDCGGNTCQCYVGPPMHMVAGGTAVCAVERAAAAPSGTWNVSAGQGSITLNTRGIIYLGIDHDSPCPACVGDPTADDGVKGGTCSGGASNGQTCDANGSDPTWPRPSGGFTSYDCLPSAGSNISGPGMLLTRTETTGHTELIPTIACDSGGGNCPCKVCSGNSSVACNSTSDCTAVGAGTCTSNGGGESTQQDSCDGACIVDGDGEGLCDGVFDVDTYCDSLVDEDGTGAYACLNNSDCMGFGGGNCTIETPRPCFGATIAADGIVDPVNPRTVSTLCVPPLSSPSVNIVTGLPGPARTRSDWVIGFAE